MGEIQFGGIGFAAQCAGQRDLVVARQFRRHQRGHLRIAAQRHHLRALRRIGSGRAGPAQAMFGPMLLQRIEPGAAQELVQAGRARCGGAGVGIKPGFELGLGQQVIEIHAGRLRGAGDGRAAGGGPVGNGPAGCLWRGHGRG